MKINQYYLHFLEPQSAEAVLQALQTLEAPGDIQPVYPGSFLIAGPISYSELKSVLEHRFSGLSWIVMKLKEGSPVQIVGSDPPADPSAHL